MDLRPITPDYSVSSQIDPDDIPAIAQAGYRSVMCNRPDGEEYGQPEFNEVAAAASAAGLEICWVPIVSGGVGASDMAAFKAALAEMPAPMLAYCRSGTRCTMLWTIAQHGTLPDRDIREATARAGYDMAGLLERLSRAG